jgi:hypothetical protein
VWSSRLLGAHVEGSTQRAVEHKLRHSEGTLELAGALVFRRLDNMSDASSGSRSRFPASEVIQRHANESRTPKRAGAVKHQVHCFARWLFMAISVSPLEMSIPSLCYQHSKMHVFPSILKIGDCGISLGALGSKQRLIISDPHMHPPRTSIGGCDALQVYLRLRGP